MPGSQLKIDVDLRKNGAAWERDISIPAQGAKDLALADTAVDRADLAFTIPGSPKFVGKLTEDGLRIAGDFTQGGATLRFQLERAAKPAVSAAEALEGFDEFVNQALVEWQVPGFAIGIVVDGEVIYAEGFGKRDVENDLPVTTKTLFAIGSATKAFTSFALGAQVDEGKLSGITSPVSACTTSTPPRTSRRVTW